MKVVVVLCALLSVSAFAQDISDFERGLICQAIDQKYPGTLPERNGAPGWLNCRVNANISRLGDGYGVIFKLSGGRTLSCSAALVSGRGRSRRPHADVDCQVVVRRSR